MQTRKTIAIVGATGAQGGNLLRAIAADGDRQFTARAITRDPSSEKARALAELGVEVVHADLDDPASLERAFAGAYGAYCVTNFWEHFSPEREIVQATNMATAAKAVGTNHVIWSTLEDMRQWVPLDDPRVPTLKGNWKVPHFDGKGQADAVFADLDLPTTWMRTSFYWENLIHFGMGPQREDDHYTITFPLGDRSLAGIAVEDIGKAALGIFKAGDRHIGQTLGIMGEALTGKEMASQLSDALDKKIIYNAVTPDTYRAFGFPGAEDLGNMFQIKRDFEAEYLANRDIALTRELNPELKTFQDWLKRYAKDIPLEQQ
jgi:uncharacterized protein YbjT (DUF2867 family)